MSMNMTTRIPPNACSSFSKCERLADPGVRVFVCGAITMRGSSQTNT